jgi:hypothetical protein
MKPRISQFQILFFALLAGVILFGAIAAIAFGPLELIWPPSILSLVLLGVSAVVASQGVFIPGILRGSARNLSGDDAARASQLANTWLTSSLVGAAMLESAVFVNLVGIFIEHNLIHLGLAVVFLAMMFLHFPGTNRILDWVDSALSRN